MIYLAVMKFLKFILKKLFKETINKKEKDDVKKLVEIL